MEYTVGIYYGKFEIRVNVVLDLKLYSSIKAEAEVHHLSEHILSLSLGSFQSYVICMISAIDFVYITFICCLQYSLHPDVSPFFHQCCCGPVKSFETRLSRRALQINFTSLELNYLCWNIPELRPCLVTSLLVERPWQQQSLRAPLEPLDLLRETYPRGLMANLPGAAIKYKRFSLMLGGLSYEGEWHFKASHGF